MKKLMITLSAAALAFGAFAADEITEPVGENFNSATEVPATIKTPGESSISDVGYSLSSASAGIPDAYVGEPAGNNLAIKTKLDAPAYYEPFTTAQDMEGGLYFDSLVKFTACDEDAVVPADSDAKIMVWVKEDETTGKTNLFVTAGYFSGTSGKIIAKNYDCGALSKYGVTLGSEADWCRLTIKAYNDISEAGDGVAGFCLWVNATDVQISGNREIGDEGSYADNLTKKMNLRKDSDMLFPSMKELDTKVQGVGFAGQGAVDDIVFTRIAPLDANEADFTADPIPDIASITINGAAVKCADEAAIVSALAELKDEDVAVIKLTAGNLQFATENGLEIPDVAAHVTIDLNGQKITAAEVSREITMPSAIFAGETAIVTIIDSSEGKTGTVVGDITTYETHIQAGIFDGYVGMSSGTITGGKFSIEAGNDPSYLNDFVAVEHMALADNGEGYLELTQVELPKHFLIMIVNGEETKVEYEEGATIEEPTAPAGKAWQTFTGWTPDFPTEMGTENITVTAQFKFLEQDTDENYLVADADDLTKLAAYVADGQVTAGKFFKQMANIDLAGIAWPGIGAANNKDKLGTETTYKAGAFQGTYDGGNFTVSNITLSCEDYIGFFGSLYGATVKNLKLSAAGTGFAKTGDHATTEDWGGALAVGVSVQSTIENVETLAGTTFKAHKATAGIVGYAAGGTVLKGCVNRLNVTSIGNEKVAGLVACAQNSGNYTPAELVIDGCSNEGNVECQASGKTRAALLVSYTDFAVKFQGTITARGTVTQAGSTANIQSIININGGSATVVDGAVITAPDSMKSTIHNGKAHAGLNFATCAEGVATFVADAALAKGNTYKVMTTDNTVEFELEAADDWIAFDQALTNATLKITSATGVIETNKTGDVTKFLAKAAAPQGVEPGKPVGLGNPGSMTLEEAQEAASKLAPVPTAEQTADGITAADLQVKAVFNGSIYQAVAEPADKYIPEVKTEGEDVQPIEVTADDFGATIKNAKKGFYYGFVAADELKADVEFAPAATFEKATGDGALKLTAPKAAEGNARFYKLSVSAVPVTVE